MSREAPITSLRLPGRLLVGGVLLAGLAIARIDLYTLFFFACYAGVGGLLVVRRPSNVIGWLLVGLAFGFTGTSIAPIVDSAALQAGTASWGDFLIVWIGSWAGHATLSGFVLLMLVFPSGSLPEPRALSVATVVACVVLTALTAVAPMIPFSPGGDGTGFLVPNRFALLPGLPAWGVIPVDLLIFPIVALLAVGIVRMLLRFRRATGVLRLQLRWLWAALAFLVLAILFGLIAPSIPGWNPGGGEWLPAIAAYPAVPLSIYVAITRYHLYDIDRVVSRSVGWLVVTAVVASVFLGALLALQALLVDVTQGQTLAVAASTLVAFALFQPVRRRAQRAVDRRFNRTRYDAEVTMRTFGERLRSETDLTAARASLVATAADAVQPQGAAVWLRRR